MGRLLWLGLHIISFLPVANTAGPSSNFNPCSTIASGFKGIDSTNRVNYVECLNYQVIQSYECNEGTYFEEQTVQCVAGTWTESEEEISTTQAENACVSVYDGFVAVDASVYVMCSNYQEAGRYSCPDEFYFDEAQQQCIDKDTSVAAPTAATTPTTMSSTETQSSEGSETSGVTFGTTCENVSEGSVALPSLQGFLICSNGEILVTEYCGASKLYNIDFEVCVNYCEGLISNSSDTYTSQVQLPKLAGQVTCGNTGTSVENVVCSPGTHFDIELGYCRNFCENQAQKFVSFPDQKGGIACDQNGNLLAVIWCESGSIYSATNGVCMQTDSPSLSPITASPTISIVTAAPTVTYMPPTQEPTIISLQPTKGKKPKPVLIDIEDNGAFSMLNLASLKGCLVATIVVLGFNA